MCEEIAMFVHKKDKLRLLVLSDLHEHLTSDNLQKLSALRFDKCILLGDILPANLSVVCSLIEKDRICGVLGNHDSWELYKNYGITELANMTINGVSVTGLSGSYNYKYKETGYAMISQSESRQIAEQAEKADILVSHDAPYKQFTSDEYDPHVGLEGISCYINTHYPKLHIHGHIHRNQKYNKNETKCISVYRCALVDYPSGKTKIIF